MRLMLESDHLLSTGEERAHGSNESTRKLEQINIEEWIKNEENLDSLCDCETELILFVISSEPTGDDDMLRTRHLCTFFTFKDEIITETNWLNEWPHSNWDESCWKKLA
jgi:hypothetical protein